MARIRCPKCAGCVERLDQAVRCINCGMYWFEQPGERAALAAKERAIAEARAAANGGGGRVMTQEWKDRIGEAQRRAWQRRRQVETEG